MKIISNYIRHLPLLLSLILIVAAVYSYLYIEDFSSSVHNAHDILVSGDEKRIESWTKHFGIWGPIVLLVGFIIQMILFILPSWLLIIVCILAYGPVFGVMISITGVFISASLAFMIGRTLNEHTLKKIIGEKTERKMSFYLERYGYKLLILLRLSPLVSNDTVSFISGFIKLKYWKFITATLSGITPLIVLTAILGQKFNNLKKGFIILTIINIIGFIVYVIIDRKKKPLYK